MTSRPGDSSDTPQSALLELAAQFHNSARTEIIDRIKQRDTALFLYLAGAATLFGLSSNSQFRPVLYAIPLLGLGASQVFSQHSVVIGALGRYLGLESDQWLRKSFPHLSIPSQWDNSDSLLWMRNGGYMRPVYLSGLSLIVAPEALAVAVAATTIGNRSILDALGIAAGVAAIALSYLSIHGAYRARKSYSLELRSYTQRLNNSPGDIEP
ncbi:hypothetical protein J3R08_000571 [Micromonospora sp. HB375]|uniref:hypothetical protein n=1 Tax=unclassified Micromonospora TaxID=2617518 RepID=UPI001AE74803|nr:MULTISPECIES: hypothetical protein [unclassified Micromonospora]MBP1780721.1 hypothetical protein [Micromonospora sp. HB375]MDH6472150.1 hypothetical protein [Micromonospora sp. H404/HB375]